MKLIQFGCYVIIGKGTASLSIYNHVCLVEIYLVEKFGETDE